MSKTRRYRGIATLPYLSVLIQYATAQQHLAIEWSKEIYGPDGPWYAVSVQVGGVENETPIALQQVTVDLYPGSTWTSFIPTNVSCNTYGSVCGKGSSWISDTAANGGEKFFSSYEPGFDDTNSGAQFEGSIAPQAITLGGQTVYQADMVNFGRDSGDKTYITYPNGVKAFPHLGVLALNAGPNQKAMAQDFPLSTTNSTPKYFSAWIPAGSLYSQSVIPSYSYGLHYGSAALNYSGSLYLGGYDKGRVIGPYTIYSSRNPALMDITIGVETGDSPLPFHNKTGLLEVGDAKQIKILSLEHVRSSIFKYALGRAFLQGAFVGWNTKTNLGWLAQAPGPGVAGLGLGIEGKDIEDDATELDVYDGTKKDYFAQSWANHWTPINAKKTSDLANDTTSDASSTGNASNVDENKPSGRHGISLSVGAIVGIAAGGAVLAVVIASALVFCILRRRRQRKTVKVVQFDRRSLWPKTPDDIAMEPPRRTFTPPPPFSQYPSDPHREPYCRDVRSA
ncbi:hypothetical protein D6C80_06384 [Aureobasidium pullulans]|nr:hypothetical protein D6C80_06384 [Aureobasidium pullulans]